MAKLHKQIAKPMRTLSYPDITFKRYGGRIMAVLQTRPNPSGLEGSGFHSLHWDRKMSEPRWFAAYVKSRHESRVARHLEKRDVEYFLPQYTSERRWSDRKVNLMMPLFPGYLFVRILIHDRMRILEAPGVLHLVGASGRPEPLDDAEIELMKAAVMKCNDPKPHSFIAVGDRVTVIRGALEGHQGLLVRDKGNHRIVLSMDLIQRSMSVEVDLDDVVPAPSSLAQSAFVPVRK
jgi:transcription antitermination factor NusG